jgi:anoctamin-10
MFPVEKSHGLLHLHHHKKKHLSLVQAAQRMGIVEYVGPVHETLWRKSVWRSMAWAIVFPPALGIREYYGEGVAMYFAWMALYIKWLMVPGILGWFIWYLKDTSSDSTPAAIDPTMSLFAFAMVIWGFFFLKMWDRSAAWHAEVWGTYDRVPVQRDIRLTFYGDEHISEVTGEKELHYPAWKRRCKYAVSFVITAALLAVAFGVMVASLNLQGYVSELRGSGRKSAFYILRLARLAQPGALFDPVGSVIVSKVPVLLHAIMIFILNQKIYRPIAVALTEWENHRTDSEFENALVLKRFIFDAFDCYIALFYLAFFECDIDRLRSELAALFVSDCIRRVLTETALPLTIRALQRRSHMKKYEASKKTDEPLQPMEADEADDDEDFRSLEGMKVTSRDMGEPYEQFDDYLEMVIQYGYIMLFASAFPLAASAALITTIIEVKSDGVKLTFVTKRPQIQRVRNIGVWNKLVVAQTWLAILTNTIIFGFSSNQMAQWFPWASVGSLPVGSDTLLAFQLGLQSAGLAFGIEHVLIIVGLIIVFSISSVPVDVKRQSEARQYHRYTQLQQLRLKSKTTNVNWQKIVRDDNSA